MLWAREQYLALMAFGEFPRPMFVELFGPLVGLEDEWRAQGAAPDEINLTAFEWDYVAVAWPGAQTGMWPPPEPPRTIEETAEHVIQVDGLGRTMKLCKGTATIALPLNYPVRTMDDWLRLKPLFEYADGRIDWDAVEAARRAQAGGALVVASIPGAFSTPRELMGDAAVCMAYYDQPELVADMCRTFRDTALRAFEQVADALVIDQLSVHEDLAGKSGPLAGPAQVREFFHPYYRPIWDLLSSHGTRIFQMDTDGNVNAVVEAFLDCGLTNMIPMEPAAGMDVVGLRRKFGRRLGMSGGIDKHVLRRSKREIRAELEYKMQPLMREGGMVFGLDHRIPNGTPVENYRCYVDLSREILGLPPRRGLEKGWRRMAF
jgi:hypothetical protein